MSQVWRNWVIPMYINDNFPSWHTFALRQGYYVQPSEIVFVSGFVKASEWGIAAFASEGRSHDVSFTGSAGSFVNAHFGISVKGEVSPFIEQRCGPARTADTTPPDMPPTRMPKDQCLFLSYYKQKSRGPFTPGKGVRVTTKSDAKDTCGTSEHRCTIPSQLRSEGSGLFARLWRKGSGKGNKSSHDSVSGELDISSIAEGLEDVSGTTDVSIIMEYRGRSHDELP